MQKKLVIVLGAISMAISALYFVSGKIIHNNIVNAVHKLDKDENFSLTIESYERGIFSSLAQLSYSDHTGTSKLTLLGHIYHGPLIMGSSPQGVTFNFGAGKIRTTPNTHLNDKVIVNTIVNYNGQATSKVFVKALHDVAPSGFTVEWDSMYGEFKHDLPLTTLSGNLNAPSLKLSNDEWEIVLNNLAFQRLDSYRGKDFKSQSKYTLRDLSFNRQDIELIKVGEVQLTMQADGNSESSNLIATGNINRARIIDQKFAQEDFIFSARNVRRSRWDQGLNFGALFNPQAVAEFATQLTDDISIGTELDLEFPKHFTESLLSYLSFEIYRTSPIGKVDPRPVPEVLRDISNSIGNLVQDAVKNKIIVEKGSHYALNFDLASNDKTDDNG